MCPETFLLSLGGTLSERLPGTSYSPAQRVPGAPGGGLALECPGGGAIECTRASLQDCQRWGCAYTMDESFGIPQPFPPTRWSTVFQAGEEGSEAQRAALSRLLERYVPAMRAHLVYGQRLPRDRADDLLQGFVLDLVLEGVLIARADPDRGKFRNLLVRSLDNYVASTIRRSRAQKRAPDHAASLDPREHPDKFRSDSSPSEVFDVQWAREVLKEVLTAMRAHCEEGSRAEIWGVFECRVMAPALRQVEPLPYEEIVRRFGFRGPAQASNALITAKRMFIRLLRAVVGEYCENEEAVEGEIRDLKEILRRARAGSGHVLRS